MTNEIIKILSIDPGLATAGWAYTEYDVNTEILHVKDFGIIEGARFANLKAQEELANLFGKRMITLSEIRTKVEELYVKYKPDYVESENAFFNRFRPAAFVALNDFICTLRGMLYREFKIPIYLISPKSIKRCIFVGDANKDDVKSAVCKNKQIVFDDPSVIESAPEHCVDSIAGAYAFIHLYLKHIQNHIPYESILESQKLKPKH